MLYVGYKSNKMLLFVPNEDGKYRVWSTSSDGYGMSNLIHDCRAVAVIDPPEEGLYTSMGECRVLKFASNSAEKHFWNWSKDGVLLVTFMPTAKEVMAMTSAFWDPVNTPHPWQLDMLNTLEKREAEIEKSESAHR